MFVVAALHSKRRPPIGVDKSRVTIEKQRVERLPPVSYSHPAKFSSLSTTQAVRRVSGPHMTRNNSDRGAWNRNEMGGRLPINAPIRIRKFIPKPLILVERMKARQLLLESSPPIASTPGVAPESLNRPATSMTAPLSTHVTPTTCRIPTPSVLSSNSSSSSSVSFRVSSLNNIMFGSGFRVMPRPARPLSVVTLADSSSSTDTFVADSPCYIKQPPCKVPVLAVTNVHLNVGSESDKKSVSETGVPVLVDSAVEKFVHRTCQSTDTFKPPMTSTPFTSSQANASGVPSPTAFMTSTVYPTCPPQPTLGFSDRFQIESLTSQGLYSFSVPNSRSAVSLSNREPLPNTAMSRSSSRALVLADLPKPALGCRQLPNRVVSPFPALVLDGVFALPHVPAPSSPSSPRSTLNGFPRPRKSTSRRPLSDISTSNAPAAASPSQSLSTSPTSSRGQSGLESPRSRLAHVLTAHVRPRMMAGARKQARVPPLVRGVDVSSDPRTQCEIEGLRVRRAVERGGGGGDGGGGGRDTIEHMSLASIGMVARLRARWEAGVVAHCGNVDGCA